MLLVGSDRRRWFESLVAVLAPAGVGPSRSEEILAEAVMAAQRLPSETLSRLTSLRLAEAAIGALATTAADSEALVASAALILARAQQLRFPSALC